MAQNRDKSLTILIGGDMESDYKELFSSKKFSEVNQPKNTLYLDSFEQFNKLVSPKRMDLFRYLVEVQSEENPKSVSQIAKELKRKQTAISRDISSLKKIGLVLIRKVKQTVYVLPNYSCVDIKVC